jgi:gluconolactonase
MTKRITLTILLVLMSTAVAAAQDMPLSQILVEGEGWKKAAKDFRTINWLGSDQTGTVILRDADGWATIALDGEVTKKGTGGVPGVDTVQPQVTAKSGFVYATLLYAFPGRVLALKKGEREFEQLKLPDKLATPSGLVLWPDEGALVVGDAKGKHLWAFRIEKDGSLSAPERYYSLSMKGGETESHVTALTVDDKARLYACTPLGIQVFDPTGRLCGVILKPGEGELTGIALGGAKGDTLYVACGDAVYTRRVQGKSVQTAKPKENK